MSAEPAVAGARFPQLGATKDPERMRQVWQQHLRPLDGNSYEVRECRIGHGYPRDGAAATVLLAETTLGFNHRPPGRPAFRLEARLDLVVLHPDGTLEHVDYKTGRFEVDEAQNLIARLVVGRNADALAAGRAFAGNEAIRTSVLYLGERRGWSRIYRRDEARQEWEALRETATAIVAGAATPVVGSLSWLPRRNALCGFCPFVDVCSATAADAADDAMAAWLSAPADRLA